MKCQPNCDSRDKTMHPKWGHCEMTEIQSCKIKMKNEPVTENSHEIRNPIVFEQ